MALSTLATTTTSFTSSLTATAAILAFTTPFAQPSNCSSLLTRTVSYYSGYGTTYSQTLLLPNTTDSRYTACLAPDGQFTFSPAVCPQGWTAWWIGQTPVVSGGMTASSTGNSSVPYVSTAYCCAPSFSMSRQDIEDNPTATCEHEYTSTTSSSGALYPSTATLSVAILSAWHISWQSTDMSTLSPRPPTLDSSGDRFTRWVPGKKPERERRDNCCPGLTSNLYFFFVVGIPILVVAAIVACLTGCCGAFRASTHPRPAAAAS